jgi:hypothetical protein
MCCAFPAPGFFGSPPPSRRDGTVIKAGSGALRDRDSRTARPSATEANHYRWKPPTERHQQQPHMAARAIRQRSPRLIATMNCEALVGAATQTQSDDLSRGLLASNCTISCSGGSGAICCPGSGGAIRSHLQTHQTVPFWTCCAITSGFRKLPWPRRFPTACDKAVLPFAICLRRPQYWRCSWTAKRSPSRSGTWADETVRFSTSGAIRGCGVLSRESRAQVGELVVTHPKNEQSATKQFNVSQKFAS